MTRFVLGPCGADLVCLAACARKGSRNREPAKKEDVREKFKIAFGFSSSSSFPPEINQLDTDGAAREKKKERKRRELGGNLEVV